MSSTNELQIQYEEKEVVLPCGYYHIESDTIYKDVVVREMSGVEEDILLNEKNAKSGTAISKALSNICTLKDKPGIKFVDQLLMVDLLYLLIQARIITYGNNYKFEVKHDQKQNGCGAVTGISLELDSLKFKAPEDVKTTGSVLLPKSKLIVEYKKNQAKDQPKLNQLMMDNVSQDKVTKLLQFRARKVLTEDGEDLGIDVIKKLALSDRKYLREKMNKSEGQAETTIDVECSGCMEKMDIELPLDQNFFCLRDLES